MIKFKELHRYLKSMFQLDWMGIHGLPHWSRVHTNAKLLAVEERKRDSTVPIYDDVLKLFAFLHDHQRLNDNSDPEHGLRAAMNAAGNLRGTFFEISDEEMQLLHYAMAYHSDGHIIAHPTVQICWDADRLDLGRVGTRPHPAYLCTETARTDLIFLENAYQRSIV